jgi:hypothetical protein
MNRSLLRCATLVALLGLAVPLGAAENEGTSFFEVFDCLIHIYARGALEARKTFITRSLLKLNRQLWKYELDKRYLVMSMQRTKPDWEEIDTAVADLRERIPQLLVALEPIASELRVYETTADPAGDVSAILIAKRNLWLERVAGIARRKAANELPSAAAEGSQILQALSQSDKALAQLIAKLQS